MFRKLILFFVGLVTLAVVFQNCSPDGFKATQVELKSQSSEVDVLISDPQFQRDDYIRGDIAKAVFTSDEIFREGDALQIPIGPEGTNIVSLTSQNTSPSFVAQETFISTNSLGFTDRGVHEVVVDSGDLYKVHVGVVPKSSITAQLQNIVLARGQSFSIAFDFIVPDTDSSRPSKYTYFQSQDPESVLEIKWTHKIGSQERELPLSRVNTETYLPQDNNRVSGRTVLPLSSVSSSDAGLYIVTVTTRVGDDIQIRSAQTLLVVESPVDPGPVDPGPVDPGPVDPGPVDPGPVDPGPADPGPVDPGSGDPGPVDPGSGDQPSPGACFIDGVEVAKNGEQKYFYSIDLVRAEGACERNRTMRTCENGFLWGDSGYPYPNCEFVPTDTDDGGQNDPVTNPAQEVYGEAHMLSARTTDPNGEGRQKHSQQMIGGGSPISRSAAISACNNFIKNGGGYYATMPKDPSYPHRATYYICVHAGEVLRYNGSVAKAFGPTSAYLFVNEPELVTALCQREAHQMDRASRGICN